MLGVGSSPRGERAPGPAGKSSPVHFLAALGAWYRASLRPTPIMDGFSFHPYPNPSDFTVPFTFTYGWPNASVLELARIKQALWDAFDGTAQPTTVERAEALPRRGGLAGRHVDPAGLHGRRERQGHDRGGAGGDLRRSRALRRLRPRRRPAQLLRLLRRADPARLAGGAPPHRRERAAPRTPPSRPRSPRPGASATARRRAGGRS